MTEISSGNCSDALVRLLRETTWEDVPPALRHELKRCVLNYFAVALAGCNDPTTQLISDIHAPFSGPRTARLVGRGERMDPPTAAALNAIASNVHDFDDTHHPTIIHPTGVVAATLLAHADTHPVPGQTFMLALLLGIETQCRIGCAVSPFHYAHGWHITSTCGVFGSAMALGKVLDLDADPLRAALGAAASQACGLVEGLGNMAKSLSVGSAARNGMMAALLARAGLTGPARPLEGRFGFTQVFGHKPDLDAIRIGLGADWHLTRVAYKPYPCGVVLHPVLDACLELAHGLTQAEIAQIETIELRGHPLLRQRTDRPGVSTGREAQVSAQHAVPMALLRGETGLSAFTDSAVQDPAVRALGGKLCFVDDPAVSVESVCVRLHLAAGRTVEQVTQVARGSLGKPLTDDELETKLRELCAYGGSACRPEPLIEAVWRLDELDDVSTLSKLASGET